METVEKSPAATIIEADTKGGIAYEMAFWQWFPEKHALDTQGGTERKFEEARWYNEPKIEQWSS